MFYTGRDDVVYALIADNIDGNTCERVDGQWVPLEDEDFDQLDGLAVDTMDPSVVPFLDDADTRNAELHRSDVEQFITQNET